MNEPQIIRALPVQLISTVNGINIIRGSIEISIVGDNAEDIVKGILRAADGEGTTLEKIISIFAGPDHPAVNKLINHLINKNILVTNKATEVKPESSLDVFYWHFGADNAHVKKNLNSYQFTIAGVNLISKQLTASLLESGITNFSIIDDPLLRNSRMFNDDKPDMKLWPFPEYQPVSYQTWRKTPPGTDCIIATSDFGVSPAISEWNSFCLDIKCNFMPIVLERLIGYIGPFVQPGETACYECLRLRENANMIDFEARRLSEFAAFDRQKVNGFHPSMAFILADVALMELLRFYSGIMLPQMGNLIEIKMLAPEMKSRKVLKLPFCPVCSPLKNRTENNIKTHSFSPSSVLSQPAFHNKNHTT